jgi:uncharacterized SAM-dependent methyltransferase
MNQELSASFDLDQFSHRAFYNDVAGRVEMHLVSSVAQEVCVADVSVSFDAGEAIHTENSYKYTVEEFQALAVGAGFTPVAAWSDRGSLFCVHLFRCG